MGINRKLNEFRQKATDDAWSNLVKDHEVFSSDEFQKKHGFSWSAVQKEAAEKGFYQPKRTTATPRQTVAVPPEKGGLDLVVPREIAQASFKTRSVQLTLEVDAMLEQIYKANPQYEKRYVFNTLLQEALDKRGVGRNDKEDKYKSKE